jgi:hypothetical protein
MKIFNFIKLKIKFIKLSTFSTMLKSEEDVLCFYVQDIVKHCRLLKEKILRIHSEQFFREINKDTILELKLDIEEVLEFVTLLPTVFKNRNFIVTGANNDQVYIADWQFLKETFQGYMDKIAKHLKFYYKCIGKFYDSKTGKLNENIIINIKEKDYTYEDVNKHFGLAINYLFDVSPLVYYDKFRDTLL